VFRYQAYPYADGFQVIEAYGEYFSRPTVGPLRHRAVATARPFWHLRRQRTTPTSASLRPPLIRYGGLLRAVERIPGARRRRVVGAPRLSVELESARQVDVGAAIRRSGVDTVVRAEGIAGSLIVGVSFIDTTPYMPAQWAKGRARFGGVDARWMGGGVQVRGEWLGGQRLTARRRPAAMPT
jgi:hypothetical protein